MFLDNFFKLVRTCNLFLFLFDPIFMVKVLFLGPAVVKAISFLWHLERWFRNNISFNLRTFHISGLVSIFLHIHPFGAGVDYICSFLQKTMPSLRVTEIELVMSKFPSVFQQELVGIGANMERRWKYAGFKTNHDLITQL